MKKLMSIVAFAIVLNMALFVGIQSMVVQKRVKLADVDNFQMANFIREPQQKAPPPESRRELPQKPQKAQKAQTKQLTESLNANGLEVSAEFDFGFELGDIGAPKIFLDSDLTAIVRIPPTYPHKAMLRNVQGWVDLMYTVTESGAVAEPIVLGAKPQGVFEKAAIKAVEKWKYQPVVQDGKAVRITVKTRIQFKLQDQATAE